MTRVAAAQLAAGTDVAVNLSACLRMIDRAADAGAELVVLPEFCNHLSWYADRAHARRMACRPGDPFLTSVAESATRHRMYVKIGVTLARPDGATTGTSLLYSPEGVLLGESDKQVLMGAENDYLDPGTRDSPVIDTPIGRIGMYACMEGVVNEVARSLAVRGAQLLLNSLNSFATDEASLHIPVRAAENKVWVVAANKVGPLLPEAQLPAIAAKLGVPPHRLHGAGESQIVAPDGIPVALAAATGEDLAVADIDVTRADDKRRPDGTDVLAARRPSLYMPLRAADGARVAAVGAAEANAAVCAAHAGSIAQRAADGTDLIVLPELTDLPVDAIVTALHGTGAYAVTTVRDGGAHVGLLLDAGGVVARQAQLHPTARHPWLTDPGDDLAIIDLAWGRIALVIGDDALFPETFRLAAIRDADVAAVPCTPTENWELSLGLAERSAENRLNVVAAGVRDGELTGAIYALSPDFTLWTAWSGPFTGVISHPEVTTVRPGSDGVRATIRPAQAVNRMVSKGTDLVAGRPRPALNAMTAYATTLSEQ
ncbi:carbon-nitrogen hydrolase family protein [Nocardia alba]|uniref:Putative amidohydrolase n=1 Tax=Nocardia alba TaxID=225051 RepID=A0A4R1FS90_9NOCA|nr:carbon-nitrogen hydrolase family protein [Nocardia alba]TCJ97120.1 putative amidohydrolase [Nocardia alba]